MKIFLENTARNEVYLDNLCFHRCKGASSLKVMDMNESEHLLERHE